MTELRIIDLPPCEHRKSVSGDRVRCQSPRMASRFVSLRTCSGEAWGLTACKYAEAPNVETTAKVHTDKLVETPCAGSMPISPARRKLTACVHLGAELRVEKCQLCGMKQVPAPVHACGLHGECQQSQFGLELPLCLTCKEYAPPRETA